jgi:hypothetical protein
MPTFDLTPEAVLTGWQQRQERAYFLAYADGNFVVYLRKPAGSGSAPPRLPSAP